MKLTAAEKARKKEKKEARQARVTERNESLATQAPESTAAIASQEEISTRYARLEFVDCLMDAGLEEEGMGAVFVIRKLRADRVLLACFLLDIYCLGVKDAFLRRERPEDYQMEMIYLNSEGDLCPVKPEYALKLITTAVDYARSLGFEPHSGYERAREIFAGVDPSGCEVNIPMGKDGMPLYIAGPNDDARRRQRIVETLTRTVGPGGFHFIMPAGR